MDEPLPSLVSSAELCIMFVCMAVCTQSGLRVACVPRCAQGAAGGLRLTRAQLEAFKQDGVLVVPGVLTAQGPGHVQGPGRVQTASFWLRSV